MNSVVIISSLSLLLLIEQSLHIAAYEPQWVQPRLFLSFWYDPPVPIEDFKATYEDIARANFTAILGGFGATTPEAVESQLAAADDLGLGVVVAASAGIRGYDGHPSLWGYQLKDEPAASEFAGLREWTDQIAEDQPGRLRYINLLPSCPPSQMNASSYEEYVAKFVDVVEPDVLSMDYYPNFNAPEWAPHPSMAGYRHDLSVMRKNSLHAGVPFWNFFGVQHVFGGEPDPTEAQIRWQVFTSLAYGSKGLMYFCYWGGILAQRYLYQPNDGTAPAAQLVLTRHYGEVRRINTDVLAWEAHLLGARSTGVWYVNATTSGRLERTDEGVDPVIERIGAVAGLGPANEFLVGQFELSDGRAAVMVVNQNPNFNSLADIAFATSAMQPVTATYFCEVDRSSSQERPVISVSQTGLQVWIGAGDARLLVLSEGEPCAGAALVV